MVSRREYQSLTSTTRGLGRRGGGVSVGASTKRVKPVSPRMSGMARVESPVKAEPPAPIIRQRTPTESIAGPEAGESVCTPTAPSSLHQPATSHPGSGAPLSSIHVARQPIFEHGRGLFGYELLYRRDAAVGRADGDDVHMSAE